MRFSAISVILLLLLLKPHLIISQKSNSHFMTSIGVPIVYKNPSYDNSLTLNNEYQLSFKKNKISVGLQFEYAAISRIIDTNVYDLLRYKCDFRNRIFGDAYCVYSFTTKHVNINPMISYQYLFISTEKIDVFSKIGFIINFNIYEKYMDLHPKLDPDTGTLLDEGPFKGSYNRTNFRYLNYDLLFGGGLNYKINKKLGLVTLVQYQHGFEFEGLIPHSLAINKIFLSLGFAFRL